MSNKNPDFKSFRDSFDKYQKKSKPSKFIDTEFDGLFDGNTEKSKTEKDNELLLQSGKLITFNTEQYDGIGKIRIWLKAKAVTFFTLAGPAGSGKSTILKKILDEFYGGVVVSAPTHKAVSVIQKITNIEGLTLHALCGLRPDVSLDEFNPNSPIFNPIAIPRITDYNLVIIDEASMINKELFELIKILTKNSRTKVLFVGDSCQIPPVGEKESVIFFQDDIEKYSLNKIERQKDTNPILIVADSLRNNLNRVDGGFERKSNINELGEGVLFTVDKKDFRELILQKFMSKEFNKNMDFCKGIAWKNETVMQSNKIVRNAIFNENSDIIEINDIIMGYRTITDESQRYCIIKNSIDYRVVEKSNLEENQYEIKGYRVKLREDLSDNQYKFQDVFIVNSDDCDNLQTYAEMHDYFSDMGKSNKKMWRKYYEFRRNNLVMSNITKFRNGYLRGSGEVIVKDLDYGYFVTCHKVQGSTYNHVAIILSDIEKNWTLKERNQLFYTSLTRPTLTATILCNRID